MCTSLVYTDANSVPYQGRTIELDVGEPYFVAYVPVGQTLRSEVPGHPPVEYTAEHAFLSGLQRQGHYRHRASRCPRVSSKHPRD